MCYATRAKWKQFPLDSRAFFHNKTTTIFYFLHNSKRRRKKKRRVFFFLLSPEQPVGKISFLVLCAPSETPQVFSYCVFSLMKKGFSTFPYTLFSTKKRKTRVCFLYVITLADTWKVVVVVVRRRNVDREEFSFLPADFTICQWSERNFVSNFITCCVYFFGWKTSRTHTNTQKWTKN